MMINKVAVGIIKQQANFLVCQRPDDKVMAGYWEFPGGKREANETSLDTLNRELKEELAIMPSRAHFLLCHYYEYHYSPILLEVWQVIDYQGTPQGQEQQQIQWCSWQQLCALKLLPANMPIISFIKHYFA